jgi:3-isopropylmalate dehydrogenase
MSANNAFHVAVLGGDGIGPEVMAPALEILRKVEAKAGLNFRFTDAPAGANHYRETGKSMPDSTVRLCEEADAILLGACGLPSVRYPDNTEIAPQIELRFIFDLYAGVRPARLIPGVPSPIVGADKRGIDLVVIRESTEGLFASMGKGVVTHEDARETMVITRKTSERLFDFSFRLAERRKARGKPGTLACVDKANVFKAFAFFRGIFDEIAKKHPDVKTDRLYVDACSAMLVKRPWDFDVMVMENMFGDIVSDITASLIGRDDAGLARRQARRRERGGSRRADRTGGRSGLCRRPQADGVWRQQRHGGHCQGSARGVVGVGGAAKRWPSRA